MDRGHGRPSLFPKMLKYSRILLKCIKIQPPQRSLRLRFLMPTFGKPLGLSLSRLLPWNKTSLRSINSSGSQIFLFKKWLNIYRQNLPLFAKSQFTPDTHQQRLLSSFFPFMPQARWSSVFLRPFAAFQNILTQPTPNSFKRIWNVLFGVSKITSGGGEGWQLGLELPPLGKWGVWHPPR